MWWSNIGILICFIRVMSCNSSFSSEREFGYYVTYFIWWFGSWSLSIIFCWNILSSIVFILISAWESLFRILCLNPLISLTLRVILFLILVRWALWPRWNFLTFCIISHWCSLLNKSIVTSIKALVCSILEDIRTFNYVSTTVSSCWIGTMRLPT